MAPPSFPPSPDQVVLPLSGLSRLSLPLPAVVLIAVTAYLLLLMGALWLQQCIRSRGLCLGCCQCEKGSPCGGCEYCLACAESCDCRVPSLRGCLDRACPRSTDCLQGAPCCPLCDCACTWQPPECESVNCLCFEIKMR
ncbi:uncharacterized protein si:ch211-198p11.6 [Acipenser ruthenus]|uniref:uncharacterized protein si:ch211-198p11.6 n=1 Tax=Acipenser ruthenus TaxID=7906 RepID=UPI00145A74CD|nr:uncharacterized protein si:ch211-198p11.6 [Acipenser ruthenus]